MEIVFGHKPRVAIDIHMKYPTEKELEGDLTEEEVKEIEKCCLEYNRTNEVVERSQHWGRAKVNIQNAQIKQNRNYDKQFVNKEALNVGDLVLLENQINKDRKEDLRFSGPYIIVDIPNAMQVIVHFDTKQMEYKKTKHPLAHLKLYNEWNFLVDSGEGSGIENSDGENMRD